MKYAALCLALMGMLGACSGKKDTSEARDPEPTPAPTSTDPKANPKANPKTATKDTADTEAAGRDGPPSAVPPGALCLDLSDIQVEPVDLEALEDEVPAPRLPAPVSKMLGSLVLHARGTVVAAKNNDDADADAKDTEVFVLPMSRCSGGSCTVGLMTVDRQGRETGLVPLPGTANVRAETPLRLLAVRADMNSDSQTELWVGYHVGDPESEPSTYHVATFSLPGLELYWHRSIVQNSPVGTDRGCDGALYPVDADCDGDGDLVLIERCGEMRCLNDDSEGCATPTEKVSVFAWEPGPRRYVEVPQKTP